MKILLTSSLLFIYLFCQSQQTQNLLVSLNKTVHVFFPSDINYTDVGSSDVLFETKGPILKLAAAISNFKETNITVITKDSYCYSFIVNYQDDIVELNYFISRETGRRIPADQLGDTTKEKITAQKGVLPTAIVRIDSIEGLCEKSLKKSFSWWDQGAFYKKVYFSLNNIFVFQDKLFFVVSAGNFSNIAYDIDYLKLNVTDKKRAKRSSIQDIEKFPIYSFKKPVQIKGSTSIDSFVLVFDKFTIPYGRKIVFEMGEKNGGRAIQYSLKKDLIINAIALN
jgi:conjugative transposon TraN protein